MYLVEARSTDYRRAYATDFLLSWTCRQERWDCRSEASRRSSVKRMLRFYSLGFLYGFYTGCVVLCMSHVTACIFMLKTLWALPELDYRVTISGDIASMYNTYTRH